MRILPRVGMRLVHVVDLSQTLTTTTHRHTLQTAWVDRPAEGVRTGQLRCATCGNLVGFKLYSVARAGSAAAGRSRQS